MAHSNSASCSFEEKLKSAVVSVVLAGGRACSVVSGAVVSSTISKG